MTVSILKDGIELINREISRFSTSDGNLAVGLSGTTMIENPLIFGKSYSIVITTPEQTITKLGMFVSYNYVVYSQPSTDENGNTVISYNVADNGLLFKIVE